MLDARTAEPHVSALLNAVTRLLQRGVLIGAVLLYLAAGLIPVAHADAYSTCIGQPGGQAECSDPIEGPPSYGANDSFPGTQGFASEQLLYAHLINGVAAGNPCSYTVQAPPYAWTLQGHGNPAIWNATI